MQILECAEPCPLIGCDRLAKHIVHQHLEHFDHIILRGSRQWTKATNVARRRGAGMCLRAWALARLAKCATEAIRLDGMRAFIGMLISSARTLFNRSIAARIAGPLTRVGPEGIWSSKETRSPSGTSSCYTYSRRRWLDKE
jgi:hypothetical protein